MVERCTYKNEEGTSSVDIIAILKSTEFKVPKIILIGEYRAPADARILEFPSGLLNQDEDPLLSAIRELKEETGYTATKVLTNFTSPSLWNDPWKSCEKT